MKIADDMLTEWRKQFEVEFPMPPDCVWTGKGYVATSYNAWETHTFIARWEGCQAARRTTPDREAWISVDERLPEEGQDVAFVVKAAKGSIQDYLNGRVLGGGFMIVGGHPTFTVPGVGFNASHWMPLPTAPTSDKGGA